MHHGAQFREGDKPGRLKGIENTFNPFNIPITVLIKDIKHLSDLSCSLNPLNQFKNFMYGKQYVDINHIYIYLSPRGHH